MIRCDIVVQDSLVGFTAHLLTFPVQQDSRMWNEKFPNVEQRKFSTVFTSTYDYRYHSVTGVCLSTSGISTLPLWICVSTTRSDNRSRGLPLTWRSRGNPSTKLAKPTSAGRSQSLLPAWRLTSKLGISALPRLLILCFGAVCHSYVSIRLAVDTTTLYQSDTVKS